MLCVFSPPQGIQGITGNEKKEEILIQHNRFFMMNTSTATIHNTRTNNPKGVYRNHVLEAESFDLAKVQVNFSLKLTFFLLCFAYGVGNFQNLVVTIPNWP